MGSCGILMKTKGKKKRANPQVSPFFRCATADRVDLLHEKYYSQQLGKASMATVGFYVDGFNLYHAINELNKPHLKWLSLADLANSFLSPGDTLYTVSYFTAYMHWDADKSRRHHEYVKALKATGVDVIESKFAKTSRYCFRHASYCKNYEEKQTDVALALRVAADTAAANLDSVILVTADSDYIPLIQHLRSSASQTKVIIAAPPGRMRRARQLCDLADDKKEIKEGRLGGCLLPRNVENSAGQVVARCPARYCR